MNLPERYNENQTVARYEPEFSLTDEQASELHALINLGRRMFNSREGTDTSLPARLYDPRLVELYETYKSVQYTPSFPPETLEGCIAMRGAATPYELQIVDDETYVDTIDKARRTFDEVRNAQALAKEYSSEDFVRAPYDKAHPTIQAKVAGALGTLGIGVGAPAVTGEPWTFLAGAVVAAGAAIAHRGFTVKEGYKIRRNLSASYRAGLESLPLDTYIERHPDDVITIQDQNFPDIRLNDDIKQMFPARITEGAKLSPSQGIEHALRTVPELKEFWDSEAAPMVKTMGYLNNESSIQRKDYKKAQERTGFTGVAETDTTNDLKEEWLDTQDKFAAELGQFVVAAHARIDRKELIDLLGGPDGSLLVTTDEELSHPQYSVINGFKNAGLDWAQKLPRNDEKDIDTIKNFVQYVTNIEQYITDESQAVNFYTGMIGRYGNLLKDYVEIPSWDEFNASYILPRSI